MYLVKYEILININEKLNKSTNNVKWRDITYKDLETRPPGFNITFITLQLSAFE